MKLIRSIQKDLHSFVGFNNAHELMGRSSARNYSEVIFSFNQYQNDKINR